MFVQWKSMMRGTRAYLRALPGVRVLTLDGNSRQRAATLQEHLQRGVLLLCLEESFAGLNLPHARTIVFAHAIVAEASAARRLEEQAIARCVRRGQTDDVQIHSFVVADSAEERVWDDAHS